MFTIVRSIVSRWLSGLNRRLSTISALHPTIANVDITAQALPVSYDKSLLENARTQLQFGDWSSLTTIEQDAINHHPDRAKLALLAATGHLQLGHMAEGRRWLGLAQDWGASRRLIAQMLVAGVHNTMGRAYLADGKNQLALNAFEDAVKVGLPNVDSKLFSEFRAVRESCIMGLLPQAARLMNIQLQHARHGQEYISQLKIMETEVELLHHELSIAVQRNQIFNKQFPSIKMNHMKSEHWKSSLKNKSVSQLGQDLWVLDTTNFKRGGYFVEVGATDGVLFSNTWLLEKEFEWEGICAEPNPKYYKKLKRNRNCIVSNQYIGKETGQEVQFIHADVYSGSKEFAYLDYHRDKRNAYATLGKISTLTTISLNDFLKQHNAPRDIDYISIDTEGSEYDLLCTFPFDKWNIKLLTIEHNYSAQREDILGLLSAHGYHRIECEFDDFYVKLTETQI